MTLVNTMSKWMLLGGCLCVGWSAAAQPVLLPAQSQIQFTIKQMGVPVQGQFKQFGGQMQFDPKQLSGSKLSFQVDVASATMGNKEADVEMPKAIWFNAAKFPQATFQSNQFKALGAGKYEVNGQLNIKGTSRSVTVPVTLTQTGSGASLSTVATGSLVVPRLAFKVGDAEWGDASIVADEVQVSFKLTWQGIAQIQ